MTKTVLSQFEKRGRLGVGLVTPPRKKQTYYRNHKKKPHKSNSAW